MPLPSTQVNTEWMGDALDLCSGNSESGYYAVHRNKVLNLSNVKGVFGIGSFQISRWKDWLKAEEADLVCLVLSQN